MSFYRKNNLSENEPKNIGNDTWLEITIRIETDTFKEVKQKRAYTPQSLIGNIGGYLGLFIGFTILDLVDFMTLFHSKILSCHSTPSID